LKFLPRYLDKTIEEIEGTKMPPFEIQPFGTRRRLPIHEGKYRGGAYHLIQIDLRTLNAKLVYPSQFRDATFLDGWNQALPQGRMADQAAIKKVKATGGKLQSAGKEKIETYVRTHPLLCFISDATNFPFNEGHFVISEGEMLPLPPGSHPISGKHHILRTANSEISFRVVNTESKSSIQAAQEGFFVPKIIHEGQPVRLLDEVPSTGGISIFDFRGHIEQIFVDSEMSSEKRVRMHSQLLEYLRNPHTYKDILQAIVSGQAVNFGQDGKISFRLNTFNHTYWIETEDGEIYCLKTYPSPDGKSPAGVTFNQGPDLLMAIAREYNFEIKNAYIGTNGKDVRVILRENNQPSPIKTTLEEASFGNYFDRPLATFIAFSWKD
jgi:hypothetical protein